MAFFRRKKSVNITESDPVYKVVYLGNVLTLVAKGDECSVKPLQTLWKNYKTFSRKDVKMKLTICNSGLKAETAEHGLTEYWAHRITFCGTHPEFPKVFAWIYRHEGKKMKPELRFHAVFCAKNQKTTEMVFFLQKNLLCALNDFKRDKISKQNARKLQEILREISPITVCKRRQFLSNGQNFRPSAENRSKSASRLLVIEENSEEEEEKNEKNEKNEKKQNFENQNFDNFDNFDNFEGGISTLKRQNSSDSSSRQSTSLGSSSRTPSDVTGEEDPDQEEEEEDRERNRDQEDEDRDRDRDEEEEEEEEEDEDEDEEEEEEEEEEDEEEDDGFGPSWSENSSPAGSWNVKRKSSGRIVGVPSRTLGGTDAPFMVAPFSNGDHRYRHRSFDAFSMQELRRAVEETSSVESGYEEARTPT